MATKLPQKILRVGIIQNGRIIEERLLSNRDSVSVGQGIRNTFVIASSKFPASTVLFDAKSEQYTLQLLDHMTGRVSLGDHVFDVDALKQSGKAKKSSKGWTLPLSDRSRGKVALGDVTILFQFVSPPPLKVLPQLPANMRGGLLLFVSSVVGLTGTFLFSLILSTLLQVGAVLYLVLMVPPPPRAGGFSQIPDRYVSLIEEPEEPEETDESDVEVTDDGTEPTEDAEEVAEESEDTEDSQSDEQEVADRYDGQTDPDEIRATAEAVVMEQSALSALTGSDNGIDLGLSFTDTLSFRDAAETLARQQAIGEGGGSGGLVSSTGLGTSSGAEGPVGRLNADTGPSSVTGDASAPEATEERDTARVEGSVRVRESRTAGSGRLDSDSLNDTLRRRRRDIQRCYERGLAQNPELGGRVEIQFTINEDGRVDDVSLRDNELGNGVGNCITGAVRRWRFDEPEGGSVVVRTPFILESGG